MTKALHVTPIPQVSSAYCEDYMGRSVIKSDLHPFSAILGYKSPFQNNSVKSYEKKKKAGCKLVLSIGNNRTSSSYCKKIITIKKLWELKKKL